MCVSIPSHCMGADRSPHPSVQRSRPGGNIGRKHKGMRVKVSRAAPAFGREITEMGPANMTTNVPEQERVRREIDARFIRAGHAPENRACDHKHWRSASQDGRYCSCGTCMVDFGD